MGQEFDTYDEELRRYMTKNERGMVRPAKNKEGKSIRVLASTMHLPGTNGVWRPNSYFPKLLSNTKPLLDRTNTPRGTLRAITLERNFAKEKWLYNKKDLDDFDPNKSKRDIDRSKSLKRLTRRQEKQRAMRATMTASKNGTAYGGQSLA